METTETRWDATDPKTQAILESALKVFTQSGFSAARIAEIAAGAGVGKGTVYEYFRSKEELLLAACLFTCRRNELQMQGDAAGSPVDPSVGFTPSPNANAVQFAYHTLHSVITVVLTRMQAEFRMFSDLQHVVDHDAELFALARTELQNKLHQWRGYARAIHEHGIATGMFRALPDPEWSSRVIVATVDGLIWQALWDDEISTDDKADGIARSWTQMLMCEPDRFAEYLG